MLHGAHVTLIFLPFVGSIIHKLRPLVAARAGHVIEPSEQLAGAAMIHFQINKAGARG